MFSDMSKGAIPGQAADVLRAARAQSALSQRELAERAGTTQASISRIERGLEQPTLARLARILGALGWRMSIELEPMRPRGE